MAREVTEEEGVLSGDTPLPPLCCMRWTCMSPCRSLDGEVGEEAEVEAARSAVSYVDCARRLERFTREAVELDTGRAGTNTGGGVRVEDTPRIPTLPVKVEWEWEYGEVR